MTTYKYALAACGLSQQDAAQIHDCSVSSVKDWCRGKSAPPFGVWQQLADLYRQIEEAADFAAGGLDPDLMDRRALNNITADDGAAPLPDSATNAAGAMALLTAIKDLEEL